jgi:hypothetical protein
MKSLRINRVCALTLLCSSLLLGATTKVSLSPSATPSAADLGVTYVTVIGHGFPSGTIAPASVTVTLNPATSGAGPSGTTTATRVTVVSGTTEQVTFRLPTTLKVPTATPYQVSIAGSTETGNEFASSNTAALTVNAPVTITTNPTLPPGTAGGNYAQTLTATGGSGGYTWSKTAGSLPPGLSLNTATGVVSGQPSTAGTSQFVAEATDSMGLHGSAEFMLTIDPPLVITTTSPLPAGTVGANYSETLAATGGSGQYTWSVSAGALPAGLTLTASTGVIAGQPTTAGLANFTIQVTDTNQATTASPFALTINSKLEIITTSPLPDGAIGETYSQTLKAIGGSGSYTWSVYEGSLPGGLSLNSSSGVISGQPTTAAASKFGIQVTDTNQATAEKAFVLTINGALEIITMSPLPSGAVDSNYSQTIKATGGSGHYTWSVIEGALPNGLTLNSSTGVISGQPNIAQTLKFGMQVTDSDNATAEKALGITINPPLQITTASPLPAATVAAPYSQTFAASGGSGGYSWSATGLPAWLSLSAAGALTGTPPLSAVDVTFNVKVTDSSGNSSSSLPYALPVTLAIITSSPLPTGQVGVGYSQALTAAGGTGSYTWSVTAGALPSNLSLAPATGVISGPPTTAGGASFTIQVKDSSSATASQPFSLTINPAASIQSLSPGSSNAGLTLEVSITGSYTHFAQGTTVASFGPGIAVGGGTAGQPGPVTVTSATSATASIAISASATVGSQTVTVTTGAEQASLTNGFSIQAAIPYISLDTTSTTPLAQGFSGFNDSYLLTGVEYWDPKYLAMVEPLKAGWIRFPSGSGSMDWDWQTGYTNSAWLAELQSEVISFTYTGLVRGQELTQAKCGAQLSDYATFIQTLGANGQVVVNGFTDTHPNSAGLEVQAAQNAGLNIIDWEIDNEAYCCPKIFATPADYLASAYNPYYQNIIAADPSATTGIYYEGQFSGLPDPPYNYLTWDSGVAAYSPIYWQSVSYHVYPILDATISTTDEEQTLNGILAHGTTEYFSSYIQPLIGTSMPVFISELSSDGYATLAFESYIYNAIFMAEYIARMSVVPQVKAIGASELYLGNTFNQGIIRAVDDYESYLIAEVKKNPNYCTDTATNPETQFSFYYSTNALALEIANLAINNSNATWATTLTGGPTVPIEGYDGNPVPAVFAQGYQGANGTHYVLITNKSGSAVPVAIQVNGSLLEETVTVSYISSASDTAENTASNQNNVQIVTTTSANPITVGPYSVTRVQW